MKALVGAAAFTSVSTLISLIVAVARTKVVAVVLGVGGVGVIGQVNTALQFAASLVAVGFATAIVRRTAVADDGEPGSASALHITAYLVILALAAPLVLFLVFGPQEAVARVLGEDTPPLARLSLAVAVPLVAVANIESAIVRGLRNVRMLTIATSLSAVVGLLLLGPLVLLFGLNGALAHVALFAGLTYGVSCIARMRATRQAGYVVSVLARPTRNALRVLLSYGSANAIAGVLNTATLLLVRAYVIGALGVEANGIYQVVLGIPAQTLVVVLNTLSSYAFPLISGLRERGHVSDALNMALRFTLLSGTPLIVGLVVFAAPLTRLLYSAQFLAAADLLPIQLLGDFFKLVAWALGLSLLGRGHLVAFTLLDTLWNVVFATGVLILTPRLGLSGTAVSYAVAYVVHTIATYTYQHRRESFRLARPNLQLVVVSVVLLTGAAILARGGQFILQLVYAGIGLSVWLWLGTQRAEWVTAWQTVTTRFRRL
ncbi:MAG: hypothetical protein ACR2IK_25540 [Chloroflexota bacterium]